MLHDQLLGGLANVTSEEFSHITVAYEPVWAIGTGVNALPEDAKKAAHAIRRQITHLYGEKAASALRVLYGGSVKQDNALAYLNTEGIDGLLVGGASLSVQEFGAIAAAAHKKEGV